MKDLSLCQKLTNSVQQLHLSKKLKNFINGKKGESDCFSLEFNPDVNVNEMYCVVDSDIKAIDLDKEKLRSLSEEATVYSHLVASSDGMSQKK